MIRRIGSNSNDRHKFEILQKFSKIGKKKPSFVLWESVKFFSLILLRYTHNLIVHAKHFSMLWKFLEHSKILGKFLQTF